MNRYVRTKSSIKKVMLERATYCLVLSNNGISEYSLSKDKIIEQADTIEELCDEFVTLSKYSNRHYEYLTLKGAINMEKQLPFEVCEIYGAIWTDKGLIYVAKMNEKGELELL